MNSLRGPDQLKNCHNLHTPIGVLKHPFCIYPQGIADGLGAKSFYQRNESSEIHHVLVLLRNRDPQGTLYRTSFGAPQARLVTGFAEFGGIRFYRWGARRPCYYADDNIGGAKRFPEESGARLADIQAKKWQSYEPRPVPILASRFIQLDRMIGPVYFALKAGEFIQGLLASIGSHERVYVVTVPPPAEHADRWPEWPRIV